MARPVLALSGPKESDNMGAIRELLEKHSKVRFVERRNGGGMPTSYETESGEVHKNFTWFYEIIRCPIMVLEKVRGKLKLVPGMVAVDYEGWLVDKRPFAIEVKKGDWNPNKTLDKREQKQLERINFIRDMGGVGGFATNADEAQAILES